MTVCPHHQAGAMQKVSHHSQLQQVSADVGAAVAVTTASWSWISSANEIMQLIATCVAIAAGIYAIIYHRTRAKAIQLAMDRGEVDREIKSGIDVS